MQNKLDKMRIELYADGIFQGYVKSVSVAKQRIESTMNKMEAKTYAKMDTITDEIERVCRITRGTLVCTIG